MDTAHDPRCRCLSCMSKPMPSTAADRAKAVLADNLVRIADVLSGEPDVSQLSNCATRLREAAAGLRIEAAPPQDEHSRRMATVDQRAEPPATPQDSPQQQEIALRADKLAGIWERHSRKSSPSWILEWGDKMAAALRQPRQVSAEAETEVAAATAWLRANPHPKYGDCADLIERKAERLHTAERERDAAVKDYGDNLVELSETHARAEAADARAKGLADHVTWLLPLAKGYVAAHPNIESTKRIVADAEAAVAKPETGNG